MEILYLIGNGFDLNLGLKTSYSDFYKYLSNEKSDNDSAIVSQFKKDINTKPNNWSDLELALGKFTSKISTVEDANELHDYLIDKLAEYLSAIEDSWSVAESEKSKFITYLLRPTTGNRILPVENGEISSYKEKWRSTSPWVTNIITFNYTNSIEKILDNNMPITLGNYYSDRPITLNGIEHIHGYIQERMILGVNDNSQLANSNFHNNTETMDRYIKSDCNSTYGLGHEKKCLDMVASADLILIFGMSYGDTDNKWWEAVGNRLEEYAKVVLFEYAKDVKFNGNQGVQLKSYKDKIKEKFFSKTKISQERIEKTKKNVFVGLNTDMFNIDIIYASNTKNTEPIAKAV